LEARRKVEAEAIALSSQGFGGCIGDGSITQPPTKLRSCFTMLARQGRNQSIAQPRYGAPSVGLGYAHLDNQPNSGFTIGLIADVSTPGQHETALYQAFLASSVPDFSYKAI
jgi:hypothetical protein